VNYNLDKELRRWLSNLAEEWEISVDEVAMSVAGYDEIDNRLKCYPILQSALSGPVLELDKFAKAARECWALGGRYDLIRFGDFVNGGDHAKNLIDGLISALPSDDTEASQRIDSFINQAIRLGCSTPSGSVVWAGAALLSSVILTSVFPCRFVDYRQSRWNKLAKALGYDHPPSGEGHYGMRLIWAGKFAADISKTDTFQIYWSEGEPLWIVAGLCWYGPSPPKPQLVPQNIEDSQSYVEDMALICGNCHRMVHRGERTLTINELRGMLEG
jgi:hypothetical protein